MTHSDPGPIRLAILDSDSGFVQVLVNRADSMGWQHRRLEAPPRPEEFAAMRVNALVVDLALLGPGAWEFLEAVASAAPSLGIVVATGRSQRHVGAVADNLLKEMAGAGIRGVRVEGMPQCDWVLIDVGDIIVHVFRPEARAFYGLEKMWSPGRAGTRQTG